MTPLITNEGLYQLIPQRPPIVMVDALWDASAIEAHTALTIAADNIFVANGCMQEVGLIEHIAQSAAAFAGYDTFQKGLPPRLGFIGEIKRFCLHGTLPQIGQTLRTQLTILGEAAGVTLMAARTSVDNVPIAECQMKIFLQD